MRRALHTLVVGLVLATGAMVSGASPHSSWFARPWQTEDGLPEHTIVGLAQTPDGYLWIATQRSLSRFDGIRFLEFAPAKPATPTAGQIRVMLLDRLGGLWLARDGGVVARVAEGKIDETILLPAVHPNAQPRAMAQDAEGNIWVSDSLGAVFRIKEGGVKVFGEAEGLAGQGVSWLAADSVGQIWFSRAGGVGVLKAGRFETVHDFGRQSARIALAREGGVWVATSSELVRLRADGSLATRFELKLGTGGAAATVVALHEGATSGLWIGTASEGLFRFDGQRVQQVEVSHPNIIISFEDREGNIWVGTRGGGLNRLSPRAVQLEGIATGLPFAAVQSACEDASGTLWVTGQNGGLARRVNGQWISATAATGWKGGEAVCVMETGQGVLIGTRQNGLFSATNGDFAALPLNQRLPNLAIQALYAGPNGDLWIAIQNGVVRHRARNDELKCFALPPEVSNIRALAQDARGDLWLGTTSDGQLFRIRDDVLSNETTNLLQGPKHIRSLQVTDDGSLWLGFVGQGLGWLKLGRLAQFRSEHGLWDDYISQILPDDRGRLWLAGNRGVFHVARSELAAVAEGREARARSVTIGREQGAPNLQASYGMCPNASRTADGRLLMPMLSGLAIVEPQRLQESARPPAIIIEQLTVNGKVVAAYDFPSRFATNNGAAAVNLRTAGSTMRLEPGVSRMEVDFTAISLASPENLTFRFKLEGFDPDWVDAGTTRSARYQRIPPGAYQFRVIACDHNGNWNKVGASIAFTVAPYLMEAMWFRWGTGLAAVGFGSGALLLALRWRYRRKLERLQQLQALELERTRIAQDLHDDLGSGLVEINLGSELAQDPILNPDEVREHTREIGARAKEMVTALDEIVWAVNPKHDSLSSLTTYFCQFAQHFLKPTPVRCHLEVERDLPAAPLNAEQRHSLFLAFKEALANVVQHARAQDVFLSIAVCNGVLEISLRDNGCGLDRDVLRTRTTADGVGNMHRRLHQLGGECEFISQPGHGTTVRFRVPLAAGGEVVSS